MPEHEIDALKLVFSDFHLGRGVYLPSGLPNLLEEFHQDAKLAELLEYYSVGPGRRGAGDVEAVFNGDFLDYLSVDVSGGYPDALFEALAVEATALICDGHPIVFDALRRFAATPGCRIRYQLGNHDPAIAWPSVQEYLRQRVGAPIEFGFDGYEFDDVRIEHGHQHEVGHQFDTAQLILPAGPLGRKEPIINFPFGCFFVACFLTGLRGRRHYISQVVPFRLYLRWAFVNDFWFALWAGIRVGAFFIKMRFIRHPTRFSRFSKTLKILRDIFWPPRLEKVAARLLDRAAYRILIMGHNHEACLRTYPHGKQYLNSGTWTGFTSFEPPLLGRHLVRSYVILEREAGGTWRAALKQWFGKPAVEESLHW